MQIALVLLRETFRTLLDVLQFMMFVRAILSWFPGFSEGRLYEFLYTLTEWIIMPVRALFDKMGWNNMMMLDLPFFVTFLFLSVISSAL